MRTGWWLPGLVCVALAGCSSGPSTTCTGAGRRCLGEELQVCTDGLWTHKEACTAGCDAVLGCLACPANGTICDGDSVRSCDAGGVPGAIVKKCPAGTCANGACVDPCAVAASQLSYLGCEYLPTVTPNPELTSPAHFAVAVANPNDRDAEVQVVRPGQPSVFRLVPANGLSTIQLPWVSDLKDLRTPTLATGGAYLLSSSLPVTVYQFNPLEYAVDCSGATCFTYTNDASLLLPTHTLTGRYMVISRPTFLFRDMVGSPPQVSYRGGEAGFFSVVGADEAAVHVTLKLAAATSAGVGTASSTIAAYNAGDSPSFTLHKQDVLQIFGAVPSACTPDMTEEGGTTGYCDLPATDLTGTEIIADGKVAVFAGHPCTFVPYYRWACDHLEEEMLPLEAWGKKYVVTKISRNPADIPDFIRIVSASDGNEVTFDPPSVHAAVKLDRGKWMEFPATANFVVDGTGPFAVAQFMAGQDYFGLGSSHEPGDPAMSLAVPVEQYRTSYIFLAPSTYDLNFVNVTAPVGAEVTLDKQSISAQLKAIGGGYAGAAIAIKAGSHLIQSLSPIGIAVYGLAPYTSYMYPGGLNIKPINKQ